jgi:glyoxylase-like metal-dependent hydrolase (beta-lactamase superfamily II)
MLHLKQFTFNPFQENTYILYNDSKEAFIVDPGNSNAKENTIITQFIQEKQLTLTRLLLTHGHIDHIMGNQFIFETYGLLPEMNEKDLFFIQSMQKTAQMYGIQAEPSPLPKHFINNNDIITLGNYEFLCLATPGHSPGSICFYCPSMNLLIGGDVLFQNSIGRTDLPMGNHQELINSIKNNLFVLPKETKVYSGHGPSTTIGNEMETNPFLN